MIRTGVVLVLLAASLQAATTSGILKKDETWEGVVNITGDVVVPEGITLTIKANALIKFSSASDDQGGGYDPTRSELIIEGILRAEGKDKYQIRFTSSNFTLPEEKVQTRVQPQAGDWYGIIFRRGGHDKSILTYSIIEFAYDGITCINASPRIFRNRIEGNFWNGILCDIISAPKISNNQVLNNGYAGINCKINSAPIIASNEITGNRYGILAQDVSTPIIGDLRMGENSGKNTIYNNLEFNLFNHTKRVLYAQRNDWGDNTKADAGIYDDDENTKYGLVVFTPPYTSGTISLVEFANIVVAAERDDEGEKAKQQQAIDSLKKKIEEKAGESTKGNLASIDEEEQKRLLDEQEKEKERLRLLEEQLKRQEEIRLEQEKQLALKKKEEEERQRKLKAEQEKSKAVAFVPTKMANELDNNPKPISKVWPEVPSKAKEAKISGTVSLRCLINTSGAVEEVHVSKRIGNKDFDQMINEAVITAVQKWTFEVGLSGGQPVKYWTVVTVLVK